MAEGRILFVDPALRGTGGHHLALALHHASLVGHDRVWFAINRRAGQVPLPPHAILPVFHHTPAEASRIRRYGRLVTALGGFGRSVQDRLPLRRPAPPDAPDPAILRARVDAARAHSLHAGDLRAACARFRPLPTDRIVVESGDAELALALAELLEDGGAGSATLAFRLMYDDVPRHPTDLTWASAAARLSRAASGTSPLRFSAETPAFAEALGAVTGGPVAVRPHPSALRPQPPPVDRNPFVLLVPGEVRSDKGLSRVRAVADALHATLGGRIVIRVQGGVTGRGIEPLPRRVDDAGYAAAWAGCHAGLLLHDSVLYRLRGSGTVCDAVASCRPFLCIEGSSLAEWTADGNAIATRGAEPTALVEGIHRLVATYDALLARTGAARDRLLAMTGVEV